MSVPLPVHLFKINPNDHKKNHKIIDDKSDLKTDLAFFAFSLILMIMLVYPFVYGSFILDKLLDIQFLESTPSKPIDVNYEKKVITEIGDKTHTITVRLQLTPSKPTITSY